MRTFLVLLVLIASTALAGCSKKSAETATEVKARYAARFAEGIQFGIAGTIRAASYDPITYDLIDVQIENEPDTLIHAKRAQIIINPENDTIMLRLQDVVSADVELGHLVEIEGFSTAEVPLGFDVRP